MQIYLKNICIFAVTIQSDLHHKYATMSIQEQQELKTRYYGEATRYMDNAKEYLKNAKKDGDIYRDAKYVRTACGTAYRREE